MSKPNNNYIPRKIFEEIKAWAESHEYFVDYLIKDFLRGANDWVIMEEGTRKELGITGAEFFFEGAGIGEIELPDNFETLVDAKHTYLSGRKMTLIIIPRQSK